MTLTLLDTNDTSDDNDAKDTSEDNDTNENNNHGHNNDSKDDDDDDTNDVPEDIDPTRVGLSDCIRPVARPDPYSRRNCKLNDIECKEM